MARESLTSPARPSALRAKLTTDLTNLLYLVYSRGAIDALAEVGVDKLEKQKLFLQNKHFASLRTLEVKRALEQLQKLQGKSLVKDDYRRVRRQKGVK